MEEVSPLGNLYSIQLMTEANMLHGGSFPDFKSFSPFRSILVDVKILDDAKRRAGRRANDQERLIHTYHLESSPPVIKLREVLTGLQIR